MFRHFMHHDEFEFDVGALAYSEPLKPALHCGYTMLKMFQMHDHTSRGIAKNNL